MLNNGLERIPTQELKFGNTNSTRIFQKLYFGKEFLQEDFFRHKKVEDTGINYLKVYQLNDNTRLSVIGDYLYKVTTENPLYNYLDTDRILVFNGDNVYLLNDLKISIKDLKVLDRYRFNNEVVNSKFTFICDIPKISRYGSNDSKVYLVDTEQIKEITESQAKIEKEKEEERFRENLEYQQQKKEEEELNKKLENLTLADYLEDNNGIVGEDYFVDKNLGIKIKFNKKISEIYSLNDVLYSYRRSVDNLIQLNYHNFIRDLVDFYRLGKYEKELSRKIAELKEDNKRHLFNFKVFSYDVDTKEEKLIKSIKIKHEFISEKNKYYFYINNVKIPKHKMRFVFEFLESNNRGNGDTLKNNYKNLENYFPQIVKYTGKQLELLKGVEKSVEVNNKRIPFHFDISNPDFNKENWHITFNGYTVTRHYTIIKEVVRNCYSSNLVTAINQLTSQLDDTNFEDLIINHVKSYLDKIKQAELKAKKLFEEFLIKNKSRVIPKENYFIVKGKLKNYKVTAKSENDIGVWTYPNNQYICINESNSQGRELCIWDKYLQFCLALLNDSNLREQIHTLTR